MPDINDRLQQIANEQDRYITAIVSGFREQMTDIVQRVQGRLVVDLGRRLTLTPDGRVEATPGNLRILRSMDNTFTEFMQEAGHPQLVERFVLQFDGQLPFFTETLQALSDTMQTPLPRPEWTATDLRAFSSLRISNVATLESIVDVVGAKAMQRSLMSVGGQPFSQLVETIASEFGRTIAESDTIGSTAMASYYRTVADRGFQIIEEDLDIEIRYIYVGPLDKLNRPFCRRMVQATEAGRSWTREELSRMSNGTTLSNVMVNAGGWNCRHQLIPKPESLKP